MRTLDRTNGFGMIEALVTVVVVAFGLLGVAGLVSRSFVAEVEGTQRTQAMLLLQDMASRIEANRIDVGSYVTGTTAITGYTGGSLSVCDPASPLSTRDQCEWGRLLAGANEVIGARNAGVLPNARGCIFQVDAGRRLFAIAVAWEGVTIGAPPLVDPAIVPNPHACGQDAFGAPNENRRRVMIFPLRLGTVGA